MSKKTSLLLVFTIMFSLSGCRQEADIEKVYLIGTSILEDTVPEYAEIISLLEYQHELESFMETAWEKREGFDTWEDFEVYAQEVYTKDYVDCFFTPKYFNEYGSYYYLDEQGNLTRRESDGIVDKIQSNTLYKMTKSENAYAVIQECETDDGIQHRIYFIIHMEEGFRIYAQIEE